MKALLSKANFLFQRGLFHQADAAFRECWERQPSVEAALGVALSSLNLGKLLDAQNWAERVIAWREAEPNLTGHGYAILGTISTDLGNYAEALEYHLRAWELARFTQSLYALARNPLSTQNAHVKKVVLSANVKDFHERDYIRVLFAQGHLLRRMGRLTDAYSNFNTANQWLRQKYPFNSHQEALRLQTLIHTVGQHISDISDTRAISLARHIYVIGLPRCGSTVLAQMLAWKTGYVSHGESQAVPKTIVALQQKLKQPILPTDFINADKEMLRAFRDGVTTEYKNTIDITATGVIDKQLWLAPFVGWLLTAFDDALVIWLRRHPGDQFISNYTILFGDERRFNHHADDFVQAWQLHDQLMSMWMQMFPGRVIPLLFEKLIDEPEKLLQPIYPLIDNVRTDVRIEDFYQQSAVVSSASDVQVRQKLNRDGIGRWNAESKYLSHRSGALEQLIRKYPL